jgi:hypothetical protein
MANEIELENYRKNVTRVVSDYEKEIEAAAKEIAHAVKELEKLGVKNPLNDLKSLLKDKDKNKKKLAECIEKSQKNADAAVLSMQTNLTVLELTPGVPEDSLKQFLTWLEKTIKERSVKLGKNVKVKLQPKFNKKGTKLEEVGLELIWNF